MDTITTAIIAGLAGISTDAIKDSYNALKGACKKKFGETSDLAEAIDKLEKKPKSEGRQTTLKEEVEATNAHEDAEIIQLAQALLEKLKEQYPTQKTTTIGNATATGGDATITHIEGSAGDIHIGRRVIHEKK
ncbi:hypothetical protein WH8501_16540 [Crocosphaera watsonii WH 8501]|uniref:Uncharacterized protein n=1 Tax=Crocosphaera watsonii WH 8501 TaxID=165597 RepID=Q4BZ05_CROWT|nr:hypothetical protein [Crocosphaera watsonii]EAM49129.1 hypothetical protein CwatDRAFT_1485 [Crocosphaera watsonii WH 8501]